MNAQEALEAIDRADPHRYRVGSRDRVPGEVKTGPCADCGCPVFGDGPLPPNVRPLCCDCANAQLTPGAREWAGQVERRLAALRRMEGD